MFDPVNKIIIKENKDKLPEEKIVWEWSSVDPENTAENGRIETLATHPSLVYHFPQSDNPQHIVEADLRSIKVIYLGVLTTVRVLVQKRDLDNTLTTSDFEPSTRIYNIKSFGNYEIIMTLPMILLQFQNNAVFLKIVMF